MSEQNGAGPKKSKGRGKAQKTIQLERQIRELLAQDHPQTVRYVFYKMVNTRLPVSVPKDDTGYQKICDVTANMRREGTLDFGWLEDSSRGSIMPSLFNSAYQILEAAANQYRSDPWTESEYHVQLWCESRSLAGLLENVCDELAINLLPCGGMPSMSMTYKAAKELKNIHNRTGKKLINLIVTDYDPAGMVIRDTIRQALKLHLAEKYSNVAIELLGVTQTQIEAENLPMTPRKPKENRYPEILWCAESETLSRAYWEKLIRETVFSYMPEERFHRAEDRDVEVREQLMELAAQL